MGRQRKTERREAAAAKEVKLQETDEISSKLQQFLSSLKFLSVQYDRFNSRRYVYQQGFQDVTDVYMRWLHYDFESYEVNDFSGQPVQAIADPNLLWKALDIGTLWKSYDVYQGCSLDWRIRYAEKARLKMLSYSPNRRIQVLEKLFAFANGWIRPGQNCNILEVGPCACMVAFATYISPNDVLVWMILLDRVPKVYGGKVVQYYFSHYLRVIDFVKSEKAASDAIRRYTSALRGDSDRWIEPELDFQSLPGEAILSFEKAVERRAGKCYPKHFSTVYLSGQETSSIIYDSSRKRWVSNIEDQPRLNQPAVESYLTQLNASLLGRLADSNSCQGFIKLLETIPNFRIKLTDEERDLIGTPGDVLAIGRSGTGKTTCALLRLFASEVLFKFRAQHVKAKRGLVLMDTHFGPEDVDQRCGLHILFVTASPVLTNEVKRFYWRLNDHIKEELERRNARRKKLEEEVKKQVESQYEAVTGNEEDSFVEIPLEREVSAEDEIKIRTEEEIMAEDIGNEEEEEQKNGRLNSMTYLTDDDFPLFLTIRRLVFMVDATLKSPFFARNSEGDIIGMTGKSEWHNEMKGVLMINNEYKQKRQGEELQGEFALSSESDEGDSSDEEIDEISAKIAKKTQELIESRKYNLSKKWTRKLSFEVDYDYFVVHFWPKIVAKSPFSPIVIWTEIAAYIKGSAESYKYAGWYLPKANYLNLGRKKSLLTAQEKGQIWELYIEYERWKVAMGAYDFQDIVNYELYFINMNGYRGVPVHYMMVDEVQDLTHATLLLIAKITEQSLFFSGDTAQTIAKGVGFRFCDLKSLFFHDDGLKVRPPVVKQLTVNFRSHGRILDLANSVVALIEAMFPETIDKLAKEKSQIDGPKPMILTGNSINELFLLLFGARKSTPVNEPGLLTRPPIEFGCDQVIIVRNQEDKDRLPDELKGALCLTVYETKGLEFDDVVLFNFFTKSEVPEVQWRILSQIEFTGEAEKAVPTTLDLLEEGPTYIKLRTPNFENSKYSLLCTELKMLYVSITRPRKRLIIYDEEASSSNYILEYWRQLGAVDVLKVIERDDHVDILGQNGSLVMESIAESTGKLAWRAQGLRMMKHRFYEQAIKCFKYSKDPVLQQRAQAYYLANSAAQLLTKTHSDLEMKKAAHAVITKAEKRKVKEDRLLALQRFAESAREFEALGMIKYAAKCYFSAKENEKAAVLFEQVEAWGQCAEANLAAGNYTAAGTMFKRTGEYLRAIEAFKSVRDWEGILDCIHENSDSMSREERETLIKKYIPIALEELMPKVVLVQEDEIKYSKIIEGEVTAQRDEYQKVIREVREEEAEDEDDSEEEKTPESMNPPVLIQEEAKSSPDPEVASVVSISSLPSESVLDMSQSVDSSLLLVSAIPQNPSSANPFGASTNPFTASTNPFDSLLLQSALPQNPAQTQAPAESSDSFSLIESEDVSEVLSHYNPDDEWLQVEKGSIVDSLQSAAKGENTLFSDYSIFDNAQAVALNEGGQLIKTKADIFVEDEIMRKILQYVSMFSDDVKGYLLSLRSAQSLVQTQEMQCNWRVFSMIDLDEIDLSLIGLTLDTLEFFELYKLCLVVCNRYQMAERLGRYVLSLAHKYSSLSTLGFQGTGHSLQKEKAVLAYTAVHNVLEMINPQILSPKSPSDPQSLGLACFQGLLLLGYWKKCVYLLDRGNALSVASTFADFKNYKNVYLTLGTPSIPENLKDLLQPDFSWLISTPLETPESCSAAILALDEVSWSLNNLYPVTLRLHLMPEEKHLRMPEFPGFAVFNKALWEFTQDRGEDKAQTLKNCLLTLGNTVNSMFRQTTFKSQCINVRIHDCLSFVTLLMYAAKHIVPVQELITRLSFEHFEDFVQAINKCILLLLQKGETSFSVYYPDMLFALLAPLGVRRIQESPVTMCLPLFSHALVHRASVLTVGQFPIIPIDLEGDFFLAPIPDLSKSVAIFYTKELAEIVQTRDRLFREYQKGEGETYPFASLEVLTKDELAVKSAACVFGEIAEQEKMQFRFLEHFPYTVRSVKPEHIGFEPTEKELIERKLADLMELGEGDAASMKYLMNTKGKEIAALERRLKKLQEDDVESNIRNRLKSLIKFLIPRMRWLISRPPLITKTARNLLLRYASDSMKTIDLLDEANRTETMAGVYLLHCLCGAELMLLDSIRVRAKPVYRTVKIGQIDSVKKEAALSGGFQEDVAWLDMQVYYRAGALGDAVATIFDFFKCQFFNLEVQTRLDLIEKAILFSLLSTFSTIRIPKYYAVRALRLSEEGEKFIYSVPVVKSNCSDLLGKALEWMANMSDEVAQAFNAMNDDSTLHKVAKVFLTSILMVLVNQKELSGPIGKGFSALKNNLSSVLGRTQFRLMNEFLSISNTKELAKFMQNLESESAQNLFFSHFVTVTCSNSRPESAVFQELDVAWYNEIRSKSTLCSLERTILKVALVKKLKSGRCRIRPQTRVSDIVEYMGLVSASIRSGIRLNEVSKKTSTFWRGNRAQMRLFPALYRNLQTVLGVNQAAGMENVLDRHFVLNQICALSRVQDQFQALLGTALETGDTGALAAYVNARTQALDSEYKAFVDWTHVVNSSRKYDLKKKPRKKWDAQWKVHIQTMQARTGKKKQAYLQYRSDRIKQFGR